MRECDSGECEVESICRVDKIEERGSRLVECLRGRLITERHASKAAKQDADLLGKRVMELEIKLKEEIEIRDKEENKLRMLQKKLEALATKIACSSSCEIERREQQLNQQQPVRFS